MVNQSDSEKDLRQTALVQAINAGRQGDTNEDLVKRADAFYAFLKGEGGDGS